MSCHIILSYMLLHDYVFDHTTTHCSMSYHITSDCITRHIPFPSSHTNVSEKETLLRKIMHIGISAFRAPNQGPESSFRCRTAGQGLAQNEHFFTDAGIAYFTYGFYYHLSDLHVTNFTNNSYGVFGTCSYSFVSSKLLKGRLLK